MLSYSYQHDSNGNRTQMNVTSPITAALSQVNYTYDSVNQLMSATKNVTTNTDETFNYDDLGNRLKKNNQATDNVYDSNNKIVEDDKYLYTHDENGNQIMKINKQSGYTHKFIWDFENKLQFITEHLNATSGPLKTHTFIYDALGRRIMKDSNGVIKKYIYDNEDILLEFDNADNLQAKYTHGPGIDEPVEMLRSNQKYFYHTDGLGSITGLSDSSGNIVQSYSYNSFGETKVFNGSGVEISPNLMIQNPFLFTAREWDPETGLYYYRARYYDPRTGRFISADPIGFHGKDSNLYRYVKNGPISLRDPSGNLFLLDDAAAMVGIVAVAGLSQGVASAVTTWQMGGSKQAILDSFYGGFVSGALAGATALGTLAFGVQTTVAISASIAVDLLYTMLTSSDVFNPADFVNGLKTLFPSYEPKNTCSIKK